MGEQKIAGRVCEICRRRLITDDESWAMTQKGSLVRGRIGYPSDDIAGVVMGPEIYVHLACENEHP